MRAIIIFILVGVFGFNNQLNGQSWSVGLRYGNLNFKDWEFDKGTIKLRGITDGRFIIGSDVKKELSGGFYLGISLDVLAANESIFLDKIGKAGSHKYAIFSIGPKIQKDIFFVKEKFGLNTGISSMFSWIESNSFFYDNDDSFRIIRVEKKDEFGNISLVPLTDVVFSGERVVERKTSLFINPEIALFYNVSRGFRLSINHQWGLNTGKPIINRVLEPIIYDKISYTASDSFRGNFKNTTIGINYLF